MPVKNTAGCKPKGAPARAPENLHPQGLVLSEGLDLQALLQSVADGQSVDEVMTSAQQPAAKKKRFAIQIKTEPPASDAFLVAQQAMGVAGWSASTGQPAAKAQAPARPQLRRRAEAQPEVPHGVASWRA